MPPDAFLHERSHFKVLVETVADGEKINDPALVEKNSRNVAARDSAPETQWR